MRLIALKKETWIKKVNSFINSGHFLSIPIQFQFLFFSIPIPSPIPGIESGIELNSHSIPELTPTLVVIVGGECGWWCIVVVIVGGNVVNVVGGA